MCHFNYLEEGGKKEKKMIKSQRRCLLFTSERNQTGSGSSQNVGRDCFCRGVTLKVRRIKNNNENKKKEGEQRGGIGGVNIIFSLSFSLLGSTKG